VARQCHAVGNSRIESAHFLVLALSAANTRRYIEGLNFHSDRSHGAGGSMGGSCTDMKTIGESTVETHGKRRVRASNWPA